MRVRMCSTKEPFHQYKLGYAKQVSYVISRKHYMQYKRGTSVQMKICTKNQYNQVISGHGNSQKGRTMFGGFIYSNIVA